MIYWHISENCNENLFSLANISVFVMSHANFGYYIHGEIVKDGNGGRMEGGEMEGMTEKGGWREREDNGTDDMVVGGVSY